MKTNSRTPVEVAKAIANAEHLEYKPSLYYAVTIRRIYVALHNKFNYVTWFKFCDIIGW